MRLNDLPRTISIRGSHHQVDRKDASEPALATAPQFAWYPLAFEGHLNDLCLTEISHGMYLNQFVCVHGHLVVGGDNPFSGCPKRTRMFSQIDG